MFNTRFHIIKAVMRLVARHNKHNNTPCQSKAAEHFAIFNLTHRCWGGTEMRQLIACTLVLLCFGTAANAASVTWLSDDRYLYVLSNYGEDSASPVFGTTTWDTSISAGAAYADQNTTINTTSVFGGTGGVSMDGIIDYNSFASFNVTFRVADGGTTLNLGGDYGGYGEYGLPGGTVSFQLKQGDTVIYQAAGGVIDYSGLLADGIYRIEAQATIGGAGFNAGGSGFDFSGEFGTTAVTFVPIPAAAWLFGSALAGLSLVRRKRVIFSGPHRHAA